MTEAETARAWDRAAEVARKANALPADKRDAYWSQIEVMLDDPSRANQIAAVMLLVERGRLELDPASDL